MRRGTSLNADQTGLELTQKSKNGSAPQFLLQNNNPLRVHTVQLENRLGEINPECCNRHVDGSFPLLVSNSTNMAHRDAVRVEPSTPSDECELVSVWRMFGEIMQHKAADTRQVQLHVLICNRLLR